MVSNFRIYKTVFCLVGALMLSFSAGSQESTNIIKAQFGLGLGSPSQGGFVQGFEGKPLNFPTVNLGLQYMFKPKVGAKLDYGFSRISNSENTSLFKLNYSRINMQVVYNANTIFGLPPRAAIFLHAGPGYSMVRPLGNYTENKASFFNVMGGIEFHYGLSDTLSIYTDVSYINGFGKDFNPVTDGNGSFNGNLLTLTFGASISLSGCYFCDQ